MRIEEEKRVLERVEFLFQILKDTIDSHFTSSNTTKNNKSFEQTMVSIGDQINVLRLIVNETLEAASNFLPPIAQVPADNTGVGQGQDMYDQLLKELTTIDPDVMAAKENQIQEQAREELRRKLEIASIKDLQVIFLSFCYAHINKQKQQMMTSLLQPKMNKKQI